MATAEKLSLQERRELNQRYSRGEITRQEFMRRMKNGRFDHDRLAIKQKYSRFLKK